MGAFMGLIGPFGNYSASLLPRIGYWIAAALIGTVVFGTAVKSIANRQPSAPRSLLWLLLIVAALALPFAFASRLAAGLLWSAADEISLLEWYLQVLVIAAPLSAGGLLLLRRRAGMPSAAIPLERAPGSLGVEPDAVLCLQMEDHYVRVHHQGGSRLVLTTMGQAQEALGPAKGLQVHRSWWVAERAIAHAIVEGRNVRLRLTNGLVVPVARSAIVKIRAAGWLEPDQATD
jgi:DNA-binding LytR/AlgR family response regulator